MLGTNTALRMKRYSNFTVVELVIATALLLSSLSCAAAIIRMDNRPGRPSDFPDLGTAVSKAKAGDIIYIAGSPDRYGVGKEIVVDKQLTLIGPGYSIAENYPENQRAQRDAQVETFRVNEGGSGAVVSGLSIDTLICDGDGVLVERCLLQGSLLVGQSRLVTATRLHQCALFIRGELAIHARDALMTSNLVIPPDAQHLRTIGDWEDWQVDRGPSTIHWSHNTIIGGAAHKGQADSRFTFANNIIYLIQISKFLSDYQPDISNNVVGDYTPEVLGIFLGTGSVDGKWQLGLTAENPARGKGEFGEDCGAFGGATPYVLSGIPSLPHFEVFKAQAVVGPSGTLSVRLRARGGE